MTLEELKNKYKDEKVLCVPSEVEYNSLKDLYAAIIKDGEFKFRYEVETNEDYLQVIPYVIVKYKDKYFITKRLGGDERLKGMVAYVGGHVDSSDEFHSICSKGVIDVEMTLLNCIDRELFEEINLDNFSMATTSIESVFVDTRSEVSRVHICALVIIDIKSDIAAEQIKVMETDKLEGSWVTLNELKDIMEQGKMEGWAEIATKKILEDTKEEM